MAGTQHNMVTKFCFYILGLAILALGIALTTKPELGISPIISAAYAAAEIWPLGFGNTTFLWYSLMVVAELVINLIMWAQIKKGKRSPEQIPGHRFKIRNRLILDVLQLPLAFVFSKFIALFTAIIPKCSEIKSVTFVDTIPMRLLILVAAVIFTGVGAAISLNVRLIPNPGDGIVQTISDFTGRDTGLIKNLFDAFCVSTSVAMGLIFAGHVIGIGVGTVIAFLGVGRVVAFYNKYISKGASY